MKCLTCVFLLGCAGCGMALGQANNPAPKPAPGFGGRFPFPTIPDGGKPQFKLQIPGNGMEAFALPQLPMLAAPRQQSPDPGMLRRPHGFAQRQPRPAMPHNMYPDLKVLPIEMAKLEAPANPGNQPTMEQIPRVWPNARIEPIPTTWQGYRLVPLTAPADGKTPNK